MQESTRVLLVEDDHLDELVLRRAIRRSTPRVQLDVARDVEQACAALDRHRYHIALVDWRLPDGTGASVVEHANQLPTPVPVIVLSREEAHDAQATLRLGAQDYLHKQELTRESLARAMRFAIARGAHQLEVLTRGKAHARGVPAVHAPARSGATPPREASAPDPLPAGLDFVVTQLQSTVIDLLSDRPPAPGGPEGSLGALLQDQRCQAESVDPASLPAGPLPLEPRLVNLATVVEHATRTLGSLQLRPVRRGGPEWVHPLLRADDRWVSRACQGVLRWAASQGVVQEPRLVECTDGPGTGAGWVVPRLVAECVGVRVEWMGCAPPPSIDALAAGPSSDLHKPSLHDAVEVVRAHGGGLRVVATPHGGRLELWLPRAGPSGAPRRPVPLQHRPRTLLLASDLDVGAELVCLLGYLGHLVVCFIDAGEAWARVSRGFRPDLVVAEVQNRPGWGGALVQSMAIAGLSPPAVLFGHQLREPDGHISHGGRVRLLQTPFTSQQVADAVCAVFPQAAVPT